MQSPYPRTWWGGWLPALLPKNPTTPSALRAPASALQAYLWPVNKNREGIHVSMPMYQLLEWFYQIKHKHKTVNEQFTCDITPLTC